MFLNYYLVSADKPESLYRIDTIPEVLSFNNLIFLNSNNLNINLVRGAYYPDIDINFIKFYLVIDNLKKINL
jgi:hypothetical protein